MHLLFLCLVSICFINITTGADWCYESQVSCNRSCLGPEEWNEVAASCEGRVQSPINIVTRKTLLDERLVPFTFSGYEEAFRSLLKNNGHTVEVDLPHSAMVSGGSLESTYRAVQLHLHWGQNGGSGSEHTIDGEQYPMELHIVHVKQEYSSLAEALEDPTGVAVLGFFFETSKSANKKYEPIIRSLGNIKQSGSNASLNGLSLDMLIPAKEDMRTYYRYQGSLTTPGCSEAVVWTLFQCTIPLSKEQLSAFSALRFSSGEPMIGTFRPVQPLNGRRVYRSGSGAVLASTIAPVISVLISIGL
ncbi:hypothetical protein ANANG_G00230680 [Anguilla anguilla]|uniref:Carbonic anhydrase n=1 Tax=Anguilla anguilla TaxID=7936 RepID=A0A9D3RN62_ANGAN|nr:hypothetical protein ANANG_G00230680 [Anguilla anguilla]